MTVDSTTRPTEHRIFLIADIRGYTKYTAEHGDEAAGALAARFAELAEQAVTSYDGVLLELRGDEALAHFSSARQALRAAIELQRLVAATDLPRGVGIGVDAGEAVAVAGGYRGTALNLAARLCSLAAAGQILATETVAHLAAHVEGARYGDPRAVRVSGFDAPIRVVSVERDVPGATAGPPARPAWLRAVSWRPLASVFLGTGAVALIVVLLALLARPAAVATGPTATPAATVPSIAAPTGSQGVSVSSPTGVPPSATPGPPPTDWPMFRGGPARIGVGDAGPTGHPIARWQFQSAGAFMTTPAVVGTIVYAISDNGVLHALADADGHELWNAPDAHNAQGPTVANGAVYVYDADGTLHALDASTGSQLWQSAEPLPGFLTAADGHVYMSTAGAIVSLDAATGHEVCRYTAPAAGNFYPPALADGVVYAGSDSGGLVAVDAATCTLKWHKDVGRDTTNSSAVVANGIVYLADVLDPNTGHLTAFDAATGAIDWQLNEPFATPAVFDGAAYSGSVNGAVAAHSTESGTEDWRFSAAGATSPAALANGIVYIAAQSQHVIYALDALSGDQLWTDDAFTGSLSAMAVTHGSIYVGTSLGVLFALSGITTPATFAWQSQAQGLKNPGAMTLAPDGKIWVADTGNDRFAILNSDGSFAGYWGTGGSGDGQFRLQRSNGDGYGAAAFAPDGSFYILDVGNRRIEHFDKNRNFVSSWGGLGSTPAKFEDPMAIAVDQKGLVHVLDDQRGVVETYDSKGNVLASFDPKLAGFNSANSMYIDRAGNAYISACCNSSNEVRKYDPNGNPLMTFGNKVGPGAFTGQPGEVAVDSAGHLFVTVENVAGPVPAAVLVFDADGQFLTSFGDQGSGDGQFAMAWGLILDGQGALYASDYRTNRIQRFDLRPLLTSQ